MLFNDQHTYTKPPIFWVKLQSMERFLGSSEANNDNKTCVIFRGTSLQTKAPLPRHELQTESAGDTQRVTYDGEEVSNLVDFRTKDLIHDDRSLFFLIILFFNFWILRTYRKIKSHQV